MLLDPAGAEKNETRATHISNAMHSCVYSDKRNMTLSIIDSDTQFSISASA